MKDKKKQHQKIKETAHPYFKNVTQAEMTFAIKFVNAQQTKNTSMKIVRAMSVSKCIQKLQKN